MEMHHHLGVVATDDNNVADIQARVAVARRPPQRPQQPVALNIINIRPKHHKATIRDNAFYRDNRTPCSK